MKRTKWEILQERRDRAQREMDLLENTPFKGGEGQCSSCGAPLPTEAAFAKHYLVDDERFLNIGNCPSRYNDGKLMPPLFSPWGGKHLYEEAYEVNKRWCEAMLEDAYMTNKVVDYLEEVPLTRHKCTECGAAYHSDEVVATICNRCSLGLPHKN